MLCGPIKEHSPLQLASGTGSSRPCIPRVIGTYVTAWSGSHTLVTLPRGNGSHFLFGTFLHFLHAVLHANGNRMGILKHKLCGRTRLHTGGLFKLDQASCRSVWAKVSPKPAKNPNAQAGAARVSHSRGGCRPAVQAPMWVTSPAGGPPLVVCLPGVWWLNTACRVSKGRVFLNRAGYLYTYIYIHTYTGI